MILRTSITTALTALLLIPACDRDPADQPTSDQPTSEQQTSEKPTSELRSDELPDDPERIVSMAPNTTELLFELDLGDRVVATTRYCDWPDEAEELPSIGGVLDPDHEAILGAEPDLVVGSKDGLDPDVVDQLDRTGTPYGFVSMEDVDSIRHGVELFGDWLGIDERTDEKLQEFDRRLEAASDRVRDQLDGAGTETLLVVDRDPIVAAGPGSFGDDLLESAGLDNAVDQGADDYPILDAERLLRTDPDLIVDVTIGDETAGAFWEDFETLEAVQTDRVLHLDDPVMLRPGPRLPRAVEHLGEALENR